MSRPGTLFVAASSPAPRDPLFASSGGVDCPSPSEVSGGCIAGLHTPVTDYASRSKPRKATPSSRRSPSAASRPVLPCALRCIASTPRRAMHRSRHENRRIGAVVRTGPLAASRRRVSRARRQPREPAARLRPRGTLPICPDARACATLRKGNRTRRERDACASQRDDRRLTGAASAMDTGIKVYSQPL
jgi:hypothetical protein